MAISSNRHQLEKDKFVERGDGQTAVAVDLEGADVSISSGGGGNNTYYAKPSGSNADATSAYVSGTTLTVTGLGWTLTENDIVSITQIPTSGLSTTHNEKSVMSVSGTTITVSDATFAATDEFIVSFNGDPRTENTPTNSNQTTRLNPDSQNNAVSASSATSQVDGTTNYYHTIQNWKNGFSIQVEDTPGAAGTNTYKVYASNQDDGTADSSKIYQDVTEYGMANMVGAAAASYTADVFLKNVAGFIPVTIKVEVVRTADGGNTDGAWDVLFNKL